MKTLTDHMKKYNLTPHQVAEMSGVPLRTVRSHLYGDRNIGHRTAIKYSQGLGISLEKLLMDDRKN
jgi:plasmid maintenance system antidote protein VapI